MTNVDTEPTALPPPTPSDAAPRHNRWSRSEDRVVLGVAGGLGRALAIEPLFVRIAFVVLALFSGTGVLLYLAGWALLADSSTSPSPQAIRRASGLVVLLASLAWVLNGYTALPGPGWVLALGLLGVAAALWRGGGTVDTSSPPASAAGADAAGAGGSTTDRWHSPTAERPPRPRREKSALAMLTIGAATVVGAAVWLLAGSSANRAALAFGWATMALAAGLLVGSFAGRARWLIVPAIVTATAAVAASALGFAGVGATGNVGDQAHYGPLYESHYTHGVGNFELWISDESDVATSVDVGIGNLTVVVPDDSHVQIDAAVGLGSISAFGSSRNGYRRRLSVDDTAGKKVMIKLTLRVGVGNIDVRRAGGPFLVTVVPTTPSYETIPPPVPPTTTVLLPAVEPASIAQAFGDGTTLLRDGSIVFADGGRIEADGSTAMVIVEQSGDGARRFENNAVIQQDGTVVSPNGFVIAQPPPPIEPTAAVTTTTGAQP